MPEATTAPESQTQAPAAAEPATPATTTDPAKPAKPSLADSLANLDDETRTFVLGEVKSAREEAKGLRDRLKAAEPDLAELNRLREASKTAEERAQEAAKTAEERAQAANLRVARAEVKAALVAAGVDDPDGIADDLNLSKFLGLDGDIDTQAVAALQQKYAAFNSPRAPRPDPSQGSGANGRTPTGPAQEFAAILQQQIHPTTG
jgi:hypothetical protein